MYGFTDAHSCDVFVKIICISVSHSGFNCLENQCLNLQLHKASTQCVTFPVLSKYLGKKRITCTTKLKASWNTEENLLKAN